MAKPRSTNPILYGLPTRTASSTSLTCFPSVNVTDWMRLHGAVGLRLGYPLKAGHLMTSMA